MPTKRKTFDIQEIAIIANSICSNPEDEISKLDEIFEILYNPHRSSQEKNIALVTAGAVLKDITPNYRVDIDTSHEQDVTHKGVVIELHAYEKKLLGYNERILAECKMKMKENPRLAIGLLTELLVNSPAFTNRKEALKACVNFVMIKRKASDLEGLDIQKICLEELKKLMIYDLTLEMTHTIISVVLDVVNQTVQKGGKRRVISKLDGRVISILAAVDFDYFEACARREAHARGEEEVNLQNEKKDFLRDIHKGSVSMTLKCFEKNKEQTFQRIFLCLLKILRNYEDFNLDVLTHSFSAVSKLASHISTNILRQIFVEVRGIVSKFHLTNYEFRLGGLICCLHILEAFGGGKDLGGESSIQTDHSWICREVSDASSGLLSNITKKNILNMIAFEVLLNCVRLLLDTSDGGGSHWFFSLPTLADLTCQLFRGAVEIRQVEKEATTRLLQTLVKTFLRWPKLCELLSLEGVSFTPLEKPKSVHKELLTLSTSSNEQIQNILQEMKEMWNEKMG